MRRSIILLLMIPLVMVTLSGCFGRSQVREETVVPLRSPYPTFTPTPVQPAPSTPEALPLEVNSQAVEVIAVDEAAAPSAPQLAASDNESQSVLAVVNDDLINIRSGPGLQYPPLRLGMRGDQFTVTGRSADDQWWQICCVEERSGWISQTYVDTDGLVDSVPVVDPDADASGIVVVNPTPPPPPAAPAPQPASPASEASAPAAPTNGTTSENAPPAEPPVPTVPFTLVAQEQFPEANNLVRIFLYVYQGDQPLAGYTLRVSKDGNELPVNAVSADVSGLTWPTASPRQRFHNLKVEFPGVSPAGVWSVELIDGGGAVVGPAATFTMTAGEMNRELYVRYERR